MYKHLLILAAIGLGGCASVNPIRASSSDMQSLNGQPLTVVSYPPPSFTALTPGVAATGGLFGALGGVITGSVMGAIGDNIIAQNGVADPAVSITTKTEGNVAMRIRASGINRVVNSGEDSVKAVSSLAGGKGLVFDLRTQSWMLGYFPTSWGRYRVTYISRARLIDASSGKLIGQMPCNYVSDETDSTASSYDELLANQAALLKIKLDKAAAHCADTIANGVFDESVVVGTPGTAASRPAVTIEAAPVPPMPPWPVAVAPAQRTAVEPVVPGTHVAVQPLSLLRQPSATAPVERMIAAGETVQLKQRVPNVDGIWWFVAYNGSTGWMSESALVE